MAGAPAPPALSGPNAETSLPSSLADRPLTLPSGAVAVELGLALWRFGSTDSEEFAPLVDFGVRGGANDDIEVGFRGRFVLYVPTDSRLFVRGRLLSGEVEIGVEAALHIPGVTPRLFGGYGGVRVLVHAAPGVRVDTGLFGGARFYVGDRQMTDGGPLDAIDPFGMGLLGPDEANEPWGLRPPGLSFSLVLEPADVFRLRLGTGLALSWEERIDKRHPVFVLPASFGLGATIPSDGAPVADLDLRFGWPAVSFSEETPAKDWQLGLSATFFP